MGRLVIGSSLVFSVLKTAPRRSWCIYLFASKFSVFFYTIVFRYNHRNFCIHMATPPVMALTPWHRLWQSKYVQSFTHQTVPSEYIHVQLLMNYPTRHPHPGMKSVLASLFPDHPLVAESSATEDHLMDEDQVRVNFGIEKEEIVCANKTTMSNSSLSWS